MSDNSQESPTQTNSFLADAATRKWLLASGIIALGMISGGYLLGDGLKRAKQADRSVTVRGLAEREVTADLATWTLSYSATASDLATAEEDIARDTASIRKFISDVGFPADALQPTGVNVSQYETKDTPTFTVRRRMTLRSNDINRAQEAVKRQFELVRAGVVLEDGSNMSFTFTKLNEIKPAMVAEATRDARAAAEQFAKDSGTSVGAIRRATQGYFSIDARDGEASGWGVSDTPYKKVRVVTTIDFNLR